MANYVDPDLVFGAPATKGAVAQPAAGTKYVDPDQVFGAAPPSTESFGGRVGRFIQDKIVTPVAPAVNAVLDFKIDSIPGLPKSAVTGVNEALRLPIGAKAKETVGTLGVAADMVAGIPAAAGRMMAFPTIAATFSAMGASPKNAATAAQMFLEDKIPEAMKAPYAVIFDRMGMKDVYEQNPLAHIMEFVNGQITKTGAYAEKSKGIPQEWIQEAMGGLFTVLGVKGLKAAERSGNFYRAGEAGKAAGDAVLARANARIAATEAAEAQRQARINEITAGPEQLRAALQEAKQNKAPTAAERLAADEVAGVAQVRGIFDEAKGKTPEVAAAESQARIAAARAQAEQVRAESPVGSQVGAVEKGRITEPTIIGEAPLAGLPPAFESALTKIHEGGRALLSAEERIAMDRVATEAGLLDSRGNPLRSSQAGGIKTNLLKILGGAALGTAVGLPAFQAYMDHYYPEKNFSWKKRFEDLLKSEPKAVEPPQEPAPRMPTSPGGKLPDLIVDSGVVAGAAAGMVLGKRGMPHPEMISSLTMPLVEKLAGPGRLENVSARMERLGVARLEDLPEIKWAEKAISRFLQGKENRVADVEIPYGQGTKPLGELLDAAIVSQPARVWQEGNKRIKSVREAMRGLENAPPDELVYELNVLARHPDALEIGAPRAATAIKSYLSHVGDYLTEHVPVDKLQQYDLTRAIRETAAWDKELAKRMEKAKLEDTAKSPVYRDYGDGMKWVQLTKPGQFARESDVMGHSVRGYEPPKGDLGRGLHKSIPHEDWVAASGNSGHPSYGLGGWEAIKNGEAKIYSLRDAKGESHATVEVGRPSVNEVDRWIQTRPPVEQKFYMDQVSSIHPEDVGKPRARVNPNFMRELAALPDVIKAMGETITQVKGKQNRAPAERYLPYVQDFVRGSKWGEVGDLENTGLTYHGPESFHALERGGKPGYYTATEMAELDKMPTGNGREATAAAGAELRALQARQQGAISPEAAKYMGAAALGGAAATGLGALVRDEAQPIGDFLMGAGLGILARSPPGQAFLKDAGGGTERLLGETSTALRNMSEPILRAATKMEMTHMEGTHQGLTRADPFLSWINERKNPLAAAVNSALMHEKLSDVRALAERAGQGKTFDEMLRVRDELGKQLEQYSFLKKLRTDYFPRVVKDVDGLFEAIGKDSRGVLEKRLHEAQVNSLKTQGRGLNEVESSIIINQYLLSKEGKQGPAGFLQKRGVQMEAALEQFYHSPTESFHSYVQKANFEIAKAKFFGRDAAMKAVDGNQYLDIDKSVGNYARRALEKGEITQDQMFELQTLLRDRFTGGEKASAPWIQTMKNVGYAGLIGNVVGAATQLGDAAMAPFYSDIRGTAKATAQAIRGKSAIRAKDFGMVDKLSDEFVSTQRSAAFLNKVFKYSGFTAVDLFGKDMILNSQFNRLQRLAQSTKGQTELFKDMGKYFEGDMPQLISDLADGKMSPLVREALFRKLSDVQPITKLEVPPAYLANPDARMFYMLKTFMLKQMDVARVRGFQKIRQGNVAEGTAFLAAYGTYLGVAGATTDMIKDWMQNKPFDPRWEEIPLQAVKTFGWSEYTLNMLKQGRPMAAVANMAAPPFQMMDTIIKGDAKALNHLPIVGKLIYPHTEAGEIAGLKLEKKIRERDDPEFQERKELRQERAKERAKSEEWKEYRKAKLRGERPLPPAGP